jgi:hypothetical protein
MRAARKRLLSDNPIGEHRYYPDGNKWVARIPTRATVVAFESLFYFDGEE